MGATDEDVVAIIRIWYSFCRTRKYINKVKWVEDVSLEHTKQKDSCNCGIYICIFIERFISSVYSYNFQDSPDLLLAYRRQMHQKLVDNADKDSIL